MDSENKSKSGQSLVGISNTITASFGAIKTIAVAGIILSVVCCITCVFLTITKIEAMQDNIYVLDNKGQVFGASSQSVSVSRGDEVRDQAKRFHDLFFNLPPDRSIIEQNIERSFDISDKSTYQYYNDLQESGFYRRLVSTGSYQQVTVDSIKVNMSSYPYHVVTFGSQLIVRESNITKNRLITECDMMEVNRSPKNIHGLEIQNFKLVDNTNIGTRKRN